MGYYIRVLGKVNPNITIDKLADTLSKEDLKASIEIDEGTPDNWTKLLIKDKDDRDIVLIEKNEVIEGELGQEEIKEFKEESIECKPISATKWLLDYFSKVNVIYAFQILSAADSEENWNIVGELKSKIWNETEGIIDDSNQYLISTIEFGCALAKTMENEIGGFVWVYDYPYWESTLVHKKTGFEIPVFHWAIKKYSDYGVDDGFKDKILALKKNLGQ